MICAILLSAGFAAYLGANVTVNVNDLVGIALKNYLERELNSSFYLLQKPCSYIISMVGSYVCLQNGTSGKLELYSTNATNIWQNGLSSSNGKTIYAKAATYQLGDYGLTLPESIEIIGENQVIFNYTGNDWAIKTNNTNLDTGRAIIKNVNVNIEGSEITDCKGGILLENMTFGFLEGISVSGGGSPSGTTTGIKIAERGGNQVTLMQCEVSGFDRGFWITADWCLLQKCASYTSNTGFLVDDSNTATTRPIETKLQDCLAYYPDYCGFNISYAKGFSVVGCSYEGEAGNDATAFYFDDGDWDSGVYGFFANPIFLDVAPSTYYSFNGNMQPYALLTIVPNLKNFVTENSGTATISASTAVTFNHGLAGTPTFVMASFNSTAVDGWKWTATSTQITITVTPTGTYKVYWTAKYTP